MVDKRITYIPSPPIPAPDTHGLHGRKVRKYLLVPDDQVIDGLVIVLLRMMGDIEIAMPRRERFG
jgi:hypothetical protein